MKLFVTNQNKPERVLRLILAAFTLPSPLILSWTTYSYVMCAVGGILLFNAVVGTCYIYRVLGVNTCKN